MHARVRAHTQFLKLDRIAHEAEAGWRAAVSNYSKSERTGRLAHITAATAEIEASRTQNAALLGTMAPRPMSSLRF